jgi:signal recognition particle receptor subunit beta
MAEYDKEQRRLTLKLVYYGPASSGKTTNLIQLHDLLAPEARGEIMTLETQNDRTLFFDFMPVGFTAPSGLKIRFKLFTVPGQMTLDSTRTAVLARADGVVFVADSQRNQGINNTQSFDSLESNARKVDLEPGEMAMVVQFNKRDLPEILSEDELRDQWSSSPWPLTFASALSGAGVLETFRALLAQVYPRIDAQFSVSSGHGLTRQLFVDAAIGASAATAGSARAGA